MSTSISTLTSILSQLKSKPPPPPDKIASLLSSAKRTLLTLNALIPTPSTSPHLLTLARQVLETGALLSIRLLQPDAFTRYFQQLLPFYELPPSSFSGRENGGDAMEIETDRSGRKWSEDRGQRSKITGLYLLLLLTKGDYAGFHTVLEGLEVEGSVGAEEDVYVQYPIKLERWLMEGSYDRVWGATKREGVPSEEFGVFSEVRSFLPLLLGEMFFGGERKILQIFWKKRAIPGEAIFHRHAWMWLNIFGPADILTPPPLHAGPNRNDTIGNRLVLGKSVSVPAHRQREEPALPRQRRQRRRVRA